MEYFESSTSANLFCQTFGKTNVDIKKALNVCCLNSAILLYKIIFIFLDNIKNLSLDLIKHSYSISSYSINYYFLKYNKIEKKLPKNLDDIIRNSYYGGRCEVFGNSRVGERVFHFDFRGMYSICMKEKLPAKNFYYAEPSNFSKPGFYKISFSSKLLIPILPVRDDLLYFPNGCYEGVYWYQEILLFLEYGGEVNKIYFAVLCDVNLCLLDFSTEMDNFRNKNPCANIIGKLISNTFYGRLGASPVGYKDIISDGIDPNAVSFIKINKKYINRVMIKTKDIGNVAVASAITSIARIKLYRALMDVINNGGRVLYCDTDSIFASFKTLEILNRVFPSGLVFDSSKETTFIQKS